MGNASKSKCFLLTFFGLLMISVGIISGFVYSCELDRNNTKTSIESINKTYLVYNETSSKFKENLIKFYSINNSYFETMNEDNKITLEIIKEMENNLITVKELSNNINDDCKDIKDNTIKTQYSIFNQNHEIMINTYVKMVYNYNNVIKEYNEWARINNHKMLDQYESNLYKSYVDLDQDGVYLGVPTE